MKFKEDKIELFINYKLNNSQDIQQSVKIYEQQLKYDKKLSKALQELQKLRNLSNAYTNSYQQLICTKNNHANQFKRESEIINTQLEQMRKEIDSRKKEKILKDQDLLEKKKIFQQFLSQHQEKCQEEDDQFQLTLQSEQLENAELAKRISEKIYKIEQLTLNVESKSKKKENYTFQSKINHQLERQKQSLEDKIREQSDLLQKMVSNKKLENERNTAVQKLIYSKLYERCNKIILNVSEKLADVFDEDEIKEDWQIDIISKMLSSLNERINILKQCIEENKMKHRTNSPRQEIETVAEEYNEIVRTKINHAQLNQIHLETYQHYEWEGLKLIEAGLKDMEVGYQTWEQKLENDQLKSDKMINQLLEKVESISNQILLIEKPKK